MKRIFLLVCIIAVFCDVQARNYYVSKGGSDKNDGTIGRPFKSIHRAATMMHPGDTCRIEKGIYSELIIPSSSGKPGLPLVFMPAQSGEEVVITGLDQLSDDKWKKVGKNVYRARLKLALGHENQVFFGNRMGTEGRWPNTGDDLLKPVLAEMKRGTTENKIVDHQLPKYDYTGGNIWVHAPKYWSNWTTEITGTAGPGEIMIQNTAPFGGPKRHVAVAGAGYYIFGIRDALDDYFEWYYDNKEQFLYVYGNEKWLQENPVGVKKRLYGFDLSEKEHVSIQGLNVFATSILTSEKSAWLTLNNVTVLYPYHSSQAKNHSSQVDKGLVLNGTNCMVQNSEIAFSSGSGIVLNGKYNKVINCYVHDTDYAGTYASCVQLAGKGNIISHCTLIRSGRSVIDYAGMYQSLIQYCDMSDAGMLTSDLGLTYGNVIEGGNSEIRYNHLHDNQGAHLNMGLYFDHGTKNIISHHNIIWNVNRSGLMINHYGNYHLVYHNTFIANDFGFRSTWGNQYEPDLFGSRFVNNVFGKPFSTNAKNFTRSNNLIHHFKDYEEYFITPDSALDAGISIVGINDHLNDNLPDIGAIERARGNWKTGHDFTKPPIVDTIRSNPAHRNLIENAAFEHEDHLFPWQHQGQVNINLTSPKYQTTPDTATVRMGKCSIELKPKGNIYQSLEHLIPGKNYTFAAMLRVDDGTKAFLKVIYPDGSEITSSPITNTHTQWQRAILETPTHDFSSLKVVIVREGLEQGKVYVDDTGFSLN